MKVCLLGNNSFYTKVICKKFDDAGISYTLISEKTINKPLSLISRIFSIPLKIKKILHSGKYKGLPMFHWFTLKLLIEDLIFKSSEISKILTDEYINYIPKANNILYTPHVNNEITKKLIEDNNFDIGIFAGVGIVDSFIIEKFNNFCLNAHPAPLPECRGGGALENTLYYNLKPSVSVHYGTAGIDEGDVVKIVTLPIVKTDTFNSISLKLSILCGQALAQTILDMQNNKPFNTINNEGTLHYWKDCSLSIQKQARKNLKNIIDKVNE